MKHIQREINNEITEIRLELVDSSRYELPYDIANLIYDCVCIPLDGETQHVISMYDHMNNTFKK